MNDTKRQQILAASVGAISLTDTGKYEEVQKDGSTVTRWNHDRDYTPAQLAQQLDEFSKDAEAGKLICLTDLFCTHKM